MKLYADDRGKPFDRAWHRADFNECFALVKGRWDTERDAAASIDYIYEVIQRRNNLLLHGSSTAYRQTLVEHPNGRHVLNRIGPDQLWREALAHGGGGYYMVQRVLAHEFELDKEPVAAAFNQLSCYCRHIDEFEGLGELPDDAACPCGSGRAVSDCHRS